MLRHFPQEFLSDTVEHKGVHTVLAELYDLHNRLHVLGILSAPTQLAILPSQVGVTSVLSLYCDQCNIYGLVKCSPQTNQVEEEALVLNVEKEAVVIHSQYGLKTGINFVSVVAVVAFVQVAS